MIVTNFIEMFHFIRPEWLFALLPLALVIALVHKRSASISGWNSFVAPELLPYLSNVGATHTSTNKWLALSICWLLAVIGLAGPTWEKAPTPVFQSEAATVYILDLSPSMLAEDIKPNRETRAKQKIIDALNIQKDGLKALIVYSGDAHLVTPLTDDSRTITSLVPALSPRIMPLTGSNIEMAIALAIETLRKGNIQNGNILLLTDGIEANAVSKVQSLLEGAPYALHIISLGDESGAPIPIGQQGFAKDSQGNIVIAKNNRNILKKLTSSTRGTFSDIAITDRDIDFLANVSEFDETRSEGQDRDFDQWQDRGFWFAWLLLPLIAYTFRSGLLFSALLATPAIALVLLVTSLNSATAFADTAAQQSDITAATDPSSFWQRLWKNDNQRGLATLQSNKAKQAAETFSDPRWKAAALYAAQEYKQASEQLQALNDGAEPTSAHDLYNQGNAQAQAGDLKAALDSYDKALALAPNMSDAIYNRNLVADLLKQQDQDQDQDQENKNEDGSQKQSESDQKGDQQDSGDSQPDTSKPQNKNSGEANQSEPDESSTGEPAQSKPDSEKNAPDKQSKGTQNQQGEEEVLGDFSDSDSPGENADQQEAKADSMPKNTPTQDQPSEAEANQPLTAEALPIDAFDHLSGEEKEAMEQWLRQVNDDPSGLLKRKFEYQYRQRREAIKNGEWSAPENDAHTRW